MSIDHTNRSSMSSPAVTPLIASLVFVALLAATWLRFHPWVPDALQGDDLHYFLDYLKQECATRPSEIFTAICADRFRPLASGFVIAEMALFGPEARPYVWINSLVMASTALLMFLISLRLSRGSVVTALAVSFAFIQSRFALYHFTQAIGPVENLTLLFCVLAMYCYVRIDGELRSAYRWASLAILFALLAAFTHERTVVVALWLVPALLLSPRLRQGSWRKLAALLLACVSVPLFYISFKIFALDTQFMIGTGGSSLSFELGTVLEHGRQAMRSMFGFNTGDQYLAGANITSEWPQAYIYAHLFLWTWLALLTVGLASALVATRGRAFISFIEVARWPVVLSGFMVATLVPVLLTIRLEQRWLMIPFAAVMLMPVWAIGNVHRRVLRPTAIAILLVMTASWIQVNTLVTRHYDDVYLVRSMQYANASRLNAAQMSDDAGDTIALLASDDICQWTLANGRFFEVYANRKLELSCQTSIEAVIEDLPAGTRLYGMDANGVINDLSERQGALGCDRGRTHFDFIQSFDTGSINDSSPVSTPTRRGAFVMPWNAIDGTKSTLTVVSGFEYRFDSIEVPEEGEPSLTFAVSMTYPSHTRARAVVNIVDEDGNAITFERDLDAPAMDAEALKFASQVVRLTEFAGRSVSVRFAVQSPYGEPNGHWVAFSSPRIVVMNP